MLRDAPVRRTGRLVVQPQILISDLEPGLPDEVKEELIALVEPELPPAAHVPHTPGHRLARTMLEYPRKGSFYKAYRSLNVSQATLRHVLRVRDRENGCRVADRFVAGGADWIYDGAQRTWLFSPVAKEDVTQLTPEARTVGIDINLRPGDERHHCGVPGFIARRASAGSDLEAVNKLARNVEPMIDGTIGGEVFLRSHPHAGIAVVVTTLAVALRSSSLHRVSRHDGVVVRGDLYFEILHQLNLGDDVETLRRIVEVHRPDHIPLEVPWPARPGAPLRSAALLNQKNGFLVLLNAASERMVSHGTVNMRTDDLRISPPSSSPSHRSSYDDLEDRLRFLSVPRSRKKDSLHRSNYDGDAEESEDKGSSRGSPLNKSSPRSNDDGRMIPGPGDSSASTSASCKRAPPSSIDPAWKKKPPQEQSLDELRARLDPRMLERAFRRAADGIEYGIIYRELRGWRENLGFKSMPELAWSWSSRMAPTLHKVGVVRKYQNAASALEKTLPALYADALRAMVEDQPFPPLSAASRLVLVSQAARGRTGAEREEAVEMYLTCAAPITAISSGDITERYSGLSDDVRRDVVAFEKGVETTRQSLQALRDHAENRRLHADEIAKRLRLLGELEDEAAAIRRVIENGVRLEDRNVSPYPVVTPMA